MQQTFRTYDLAVQLYREVKSIQLPGFLKNQLLRAASSVALNLLQALDAIAGIRNIWLY